MISPDGSCRSAGQIGAYLSSSTSSSTNNCKIVSVLDCNDVGCDIINRLFDTDISLKSTGISVGINKDAMAIIYGSFHEMYSDDKYCGSKAADFMSSMCNTVFLSLPSIDISEVLKSHDQIFRRILTTAIKDTKNIQIVCIIDNNDIEKEIESYMSRIFDEVVSLSGSTAIANDHYSIQFVSSSFIEGKQSINEILSNDVNSQQTEILPEKLSNTWSEVLLGRPRALLSIEESQSLIDVEEAYNAGILQYERALDQMRNRVNSGKIVESFGSRIDSLLNGILTSFYGRTRGCRVIRERAQRVALLKSSIRAAGQSLFKQQLDILQSKSVNDFKKSLVTILKNDGDSDEYSQAQRKTLYDYRTEVGKLESDSLDMNGGASYTELSNTLDSILKEFPESTVAKLTALQKMDKQTKKSKKKKGRAVNLGLSLVGMLRPPGYGNLQGFAGYSTGFFGLPLDLLLGIQNDGDSPEVMGEDREFPILRLQPKVHFDVDV